MTNIIPTKKTITDGIKDAGRYGFIGGGSVAIGRAIAGGFGGALLAHTVSGLLQKPAEISEIDKKIIRGNAWMDWVASMGL